MLIPDAVHVWREPDGDYHVEWRTSDDTTQVTVEHVGGSELEALQTSAAGKAPAAGQARFSGQSLRGLHSFVLRDEHGNEVIASERRLPLQGAPNFRDFGGYRTAQGQSVKWGYLFRSGQLNGLSDADLEIIGALNLDIICDFRRVEEQSTEPTRLPVGTPPRIVSLPIVPGSNSRFFEEAQDMQGDRQAMFDFMVEINRDFALSQTETYRRMFAEILAVEDARFLVHCAAGKDRTGFAVAMVLFALGVPREVVMSDYLLTARFYHPREQVQRLQAKYEMEHMDAEAVLPMLEVHDDYLRQAFTSIDQHYPSIDEYLRDALGLGEAERAELRARYLRED